MRTHLDVQRLARPEQRNRQQRPDDPHDEEARDRGGHGRQRRDVDGPTEDDRQQHVVGEHEVRSEDDGRDHAGRRSLREGHRHEHDAADGAADLGDDVPDRGPHGQQRAQRHPEDEPGDQHLEALEHGEQERAGEVPTDDPTHDGAEAARGLAPTDRHEPGGAVDQPRAVDEQRDQQDAGADAEQHGGGGGLGGARDLGRVTGELLGQLGRPVLDLAGDVIFGEAVADQGQVAEILQHVRQILLERPRPVRRSGARTTPPRTPRRRRPCP